MNEVEKDTYSIQDELSQLDTWTKDWIRMLKDMSDTAEQGIKNLEQNSMGSVVSNLKQKLEESKIESLESRVKNMGTDVSNLRQNLRANIKDEEEV